MENNKIHILVVDDDNRIRSLLKEYLNENDYIVSTSEDAEDAKIKSELIEKEEVKIKQKAEKDAEDIKTESELIEKEEKKIKEINSMEEEEEMLK